MKADEEKERYLAKITKEKLDKELALKELHSKKRAELNSREIDLCLSKLEEIK